MSKEDAGQSQKSISSCKYNNCDGSGMILNSDTNTATMCKCYYDKIINRKLDFANIPLEFSELTINSFDVNLYTTEENKEKARVAKKSAVNFINNFELFSSQGKGLYLYSEVKGSGKTRMAASIGNALIKTKSIGVKYTTTMDLLNEIKKTFHKDSKITESDLIETIKKVEVLILDDVGVEEPTNWVNTIFYNLLNGRMINKKITIFTSNTNIETLRHDDRIKNRIEKMGLPIEFPNESIRSNLAKQENEELQKILLG